MHQRVSYMYTTLLVAVASSRLLAGSTASEVMPRWREALDDCSHGGCRMAMGVGVRAFEFARADVVPSPRRARRSQILIVPSVAPACEEGEEGMGEEGVSEDVEVGRCARGADEM